MLYIINFIWIVGIDEFIEYLIEIGLFIISIYLKLFNGYI